MKLILRLFIIGMFTIGLGDQKAPAQIANVVITGPVKITGNVTIGGSIVLGLHWFTLTNAQWNAMTNAQWNSMIE
jgi:hypothetical protein